MPEPKAVRGALPGSNSDDKSNYYDYNDCVTAEANSHQTEPSNTAASAPRTQRIMACGPPRAFRKWDRIIKGSTLPY